MMFTISFAICYLCVVYGAIPPGQNAYLPPEKAGYVYEKPEHPLKSSTITPKPPSLLVPRPTYGLPPPLIPTYRPPTLQPARPTYGPPISRPPRPTYGPPVSQPPKPTYGLPSLQPLRPMYETPSPAIPHPSYGPPSQPPPTLTYTPTSSPLYTGKPPRPNNPPPFKPQPPSTLPTLMALYQGSHDDHHHHHHEPGMPFDFTYAVREPQFGNDFSHNAISDGDITKGEYKVQLPDGRTQVVKYTADWQHGYHAQISYEGQLNYQSFSPSSTRPIAGGTPPQTFTSSGGYTY